MAIVSSGSPAVTKRPPEGGRMIDAHWHSIFAALPISALVSADVGYIFLAASSDAERTLLRGFTTVRDLGGPSFALKQAIDDGLVVGPCIYPSGAMITTTGGRGSPSSVRSANESWRTVEPHGANGWLQHR